MQGKVLVTGGYGFIGSNFVRMIANQADVVVVDNFSVGSNRANLRDVPVKTVELDIRDPRMLDLIRDERPDFIFNFAAESHVDRSIVDPLSFVSTNVLGTANLLEGARRYDVTFIQIGTDEEYGEIYSGSFRETDPLNPSSPYSASKAGATLLAMAYARTYHLDVRVTRSANNYGPYQYPEKLIPKTVIRALHNLPVPVYGTGKNVRDWIYVQDNCEAILTVAEKGKPGIYNVSAGEEKTNLEVVTTILEILGKPNLIKFVEDRPGHDFRYSVDSTKLRELGWRPRTSFREGISLTVDWYVKNRWWWEGINSRVLEETPFRGSVNG
ncbi:MULTISPECIES: dTDP-glucose 4,6-dehydratase [Metallosphaera]|uniref:dTDP-glucose 4,6-dehydratase n=3 Tax=Metallosphaera TaxID=41980 RepID=A4YHT8_METS5|nr:MULTISPECIES: dTDP-glucose 4,6-dehydratase [Metallosphaera]ABP95990.1 dTDP-glucose 4,6-dehydratase [Metallosphaera sedula DSM 5348]AIM27974.1 dTDP-glucose 4,6-dehydratase [Metallosphaera sedula]AKV74810.1 dTDP-glucose 4,6-dehydratase [Metallosphaera sedula]AKV77046.1 dTDP-glucose 4,6-dehydratase [Metallosphaera sedula]AKV79298.1 dTDP-glucose 4,6-dehydratase [Metallosphaera sedula]